MDLNEPVMFIHGNRFSLKIDFIEGFVDGFEVVSERGLIS
jgi:hypothetical protein